MPVPDGPLDDLRQSGFGCTLSFGMLGPSRVYVGFASLPPGLESLGNGVILPHKEDTYPPSQYSSHWKGSIEDVEINFFFTCYNSVEGLWRTSVDVNSSNPAHVGGCFSEHANLVWGFGYILLDSFVGPFHGAVVKRVAEWQTPSLIWPGVAFAEFV